MTRLLGRAGSFFVLALVIIGLATLVIASDVARFGNTDGGETADAALVLGAAVLGDRPSPVLRERLRHAVALYEQGRVSKLVLTGGLSPEDSLTEAEAGRRWVLAQGVPDADIILEDRSRTTVENFVLAEPLLATNNIETVLVVSDPIHMRRAMTIAGRTGMAAASSPTPSSRFVSLDTQLPFLLRETWFMATYLLFGW
jgi:uncharacterized SAM-binding protein YcdF (DUF218 family)